MAGQQERDHHAAGEIEDERREPELPELEPGAAVAAEAGDRDEEVLREELGAAHHDEDEADPERERARQVADADSEALGDGGSREAERGETEGDVEAADERRRGQLEER